MASTRNLVSNREPGAPLFGMQFQQDLATQKNLRSKYFNTNNNCKILLKALHTSLKRKDPATFLKRSSSGGTGFTFLGQISSSAILNEIPDQRIGFVVKWQSEEQCNVERIGALFFKALGFPAPETYRVDHSIANSIGPFAIKECPSLETTYKSLSLIAMPQLDANNFKEASKSKIKQMSIEDQKVMLQKFGEIALLDIILGNNDRFISFTDNVDSPFSLTSTFNSGNVMMEFEEFEDGNQKLVNVFPIDNCTLNMADKKKRTCDLNEEVGFGLFEENLLDAPGASPSLTGENSLQPASEFDDPVNAENLFQSKIVNLNQVCIKLIKDLDCVAKHIQNNIVNDLKERETNIEEYQQFIDMAPEQLIAGMKKALTMAKTFDVDSFVKQIESEKLDSFSNRALRLIKMNVQSIQQL